MTDATLKIVIDAVNKGDKVIKGLTNDLKGVEGAGSRASVVMGKLKGILGAAGVTGAVLAVGNAVKKSLTDWSTYAEEMEKSARLAGVSSEEMSRLTQAADDFRVSQDSLKTAMAMALKNGFVPTIENLAKLSDEFLAIQDPAERAAMMSKIFGRQWAEIEPLLRQGGKAIRDGTAAIADNLIVTEEAVKKNKEYIAQVDEMQDTWTGFKNTIGQITVPIVTDLMKIVTNSENMWDFLRRIKLEQKESDPVMKTYADRLNAQYEAYLKLKPEAQGTADATQAVADATNNADAAMRAYTESLLFQLASQGLSQEEALKLAYAMGLVDERTVLATEKTNHYREMLESGKISLATYIALVEGLKQSIDGLSDKTITVTYNQVTTGTAPNGMWQGTGGTGSTQGQRASGGAVKGGNMYRWQEYGGELLVPSQNGYVLSRADAERIVTKAIQGQGTTEQQPLIGTLVVQNPLTLEMVMAQVENRLARR